jgi:hypothetical protein
MPDIYEQGKRDQTMSEYRTETKPKLPTGWTWQDAERERERWEIAKGMLPLSAAGGAVAWGYPLPCDCDA